MARGTSKSEAVPEAKKKFRKLEWLTFAIVGMVLAVMEVFYFTIVKVPARDCILEWLFVMAVVTLVIHFGFRRIYRIQDELTSNQQQARKYLDVAGVMLVVIAADQRISLINRKGCDILGFEEKDIIGKNWFDTFVPERIRDEVKTVFEKLMSGEIEPVEFFENPVLTKSSEERIVAWHNTILKDGEGKAIATLSSGEDMTERKLGEDALRESEERYRTILEGVEDGYFEVDLAGNFTFANDSMCRILGYSEEEVIGMNNRAYMDEDTAKLLYKTFNQVYRTGKPIEGFCGEIFRRDGATRFLETSASPVRNREGEIVGFRGVMRDVTERKQAEEALMQSEERYRTILREMQDGYFEVDLAGNLTFFNDATLRHTGYSREELLRMNHRDYIAPEDVKTAYNTCAKVYETGKPSAIFPFKTVRKDGSIRFVETRVSPLRNEKGKIIGFRGTSRDITERKRAGEALRQSEEKYRTILEDMEGGYYEVDIAGNFTFANDSMCRTLGYSEEEVIGMNNRAYMDEDTAKLVYKTFNEVYRTGEPAKWVSWEVLRKSGERRFLETSIYALRNEAGETIGFRGIINDVTDRRRAEEQLLMTSKLASVGELAAGVAHELNNPLTGIMGYAQLLSTRQNVPRDVKVDLDRIHSESQRAAKVVQNLLSFARRRRPEKTYLDVNELIQKTLELRSYELRTSNIGIYVDLAPDLPQILADYHQIQQVLLNLIVNAEQAIAERKRRSKITVTTSAVGDHVEISIADNGYGIAREDIDKVFDPFFTTKEVGTGTGLGLSVCYGIVTDHGGKIYVESQKGKGTTFTIELPLTKQVQAVVEEKEAAGKRSRRRRQKATVRILVVDDEPAVCDVLARSLSEHGYVADSALSAKTALQKVAGNNYGLCIIDLKMPQTSGKELYEIMKHRYPSSAEKVVFITGDTITPTTQNFLTSTGKACLAKPFDSKQVMELIEESLGGKQ